MDYRKIIIYILLVIIGLAVWQKLKQDDQKTSVLTERFAQVYAGTSVLAEIYRNEPERFYQARDSICRVYNFDTDSIAAYQESFEGREGEWIETWSRVRQITDSLIKYFNENPVSHPSKDTVLTND